MYYVNLLTPKKRERQERWVVKQVEVEYLVLCIFPLLIWKLPVNPMVKYIVVYTTTLVERCVETKTFFHYQFQFQLEVGLTKK